MLLRRSIAVVTGIGAFVAFVVLGHFIFDAVALPDLCDYHNKDVDTGWLFDLYFPTTSGNGSHPGPGLVFYFTALVGALTVGFSMLRWMKRCGAT